MSTNKSEHLQLHLWEPGDSVLRTEFNENWEKLDASAAQAQAHASAVCLVNFIFPFSAIPAESSFRISRIADLQYTFSFLLYIILSCASMHKTNQKPHDNNPIILLIRPVSARFNENI